MTSSPDHPSDREEILRALLVGELGPDDPGVQELLASDASFSAEVEELLSLRGQLDEAGGIEREVERIAKEELVGERAALEQRFQKRMESFLPAAMDAATKEAEKLGPKPLSDGLSPQSEGQPPALRGLGLTLMAVAAAVLLIWWLGFDRNSPDPSRSNPYERVMLGDGDLEPRLTLDEDGAAGSLEWSQPSGAGRFTVLIQELDRSGESEPRTLLEERVRSASQLRLDPLPWSADHETILIRVEHWVGGMTQPESTGELRLPASS